MAFVLISVTLLVMLLICIQVDKAPGRWQQMMRNGEATADSSIMVLRSWSSLRTGLLNHSQLPRNAGLYLRGAKHVHTCGMLFPIDVVFLAKNGRVLAWETIAPGVRRVKSPRGTKHVLELAEKAATEVFSLQRNDLLAFAPHPNDTKSSVAKEAVC